MKNKVTTGQVSIGPEFFAKAREDYAHWQWALVREFLQNSLDAGSTEVSVGTCYREGVTFLTVRDNGKGMTEDVLVNKLLSLGSSGKDFADNNVGGFGKAKEILYFCWDSYTILTGDLKLEGRGSNYTLTGGQPVVKGVSSSITMPGGDYSGVLEEQLMEFAALVQTKARITLNGSDLHAGLAKGAKRRDLPCGTLYTNRQLENVLVVRVNGIPMYRRYVGFEGCVVLELTNSKVLTSNRDGLRSPHSEELNAFITDLTTSKAKALKPLNTGYYHFTGERLHNKGRKARDMVAASGDALPTELVAALALANELGDEEGITFAVSPIVSKKANYAAAEPGTVVEHAPRKQSRLHNEFYVKCEYATKTALLDKYLPDNAKWSKHADGLARVWTRLMVAMHQLFEHEAEFAVGFLFSEDAAAQSDRSANKGQIYLVRPAFRKHGEKGATDYLRWSTPRERGDLIMSALHEFVHGLGYGPHDETYANRLTTMAGVVLAEVERFDWCFEGTVGGE